MNGVFAFFSIPRCFNCDLAKHTTMHHHVATIIALAGDIDSAWQETTPCPYCNLRAYNQFRGYEPRT